MTDFKLKLRCKCGHIQGGLCVSGRAGNHLICMCKDCQAYARFLTRSDDLLDPYGGTEVYQVTPADVRITLGIEYLKCMQLSPKGIFRWYAGCCNTPIANTPSKAGLPFAGIPIHFIDVEAGQRGVALGPIMAKIHNRYCLGDPPLDSVSKVPISVLLKIIYRVFKAKLQGKSFPNPFFDAATGEPVTAPSVLTKEQRLALARSK